MGIKWQLQDIVINAMIASAPIVVQTCHAELDAVYLSVSVSSRLQSMRVEMLL